MTKTLGSHHLPRPRLRRGDRILHRQARLRADRGFAARRRQALGACRAARTRAETSLLLAKAVTPEQIARIGNQAGGRVFLFLHTDDFWRRLRCDAVARRDVSRDAAQGAVRDRGGVRRPLRKQVGSAAACDVSRLFAGEAKPAKQASPARIPRRAHLHMASTEFHRPLPRPAQKNRAVRDSGTSGRERRSARRSISTPWKRRRA